MACRAYQNFSNWLLTDAHQSHPCSSFIPLRKRCQPLQTDPLATNSSSPPLPNPSKHVSPPSSQKASDIPFPCFHRHFQNSKETQKSCRTSLQKQKRNSRLISQVPSPLLFYQYHHPHISTPSPNVNSHLEFPTSVAGAGSYPAGNYSMVSHQSIGLSQFLPSSDAHPSIGKPGELTKLEEVRVEVLCVGREVVVGAVEALRRRVSLSFL